MTECKGTTILEKCLKDVSEIAAVNVSGIKRFLALN